MSVQPLIKTPDSALPPWRTNNLFIENDALASNNLIHIRADALTIEDVLASPVAFDVDKTVVGAGGIDIDPGSQVSDDFDRATSGSLGANWDEAGEAGDEVANDQMAGIDVNTLILKDNQGAVADMWGFVRWASDVGGGDHYASLKFDSASANDPANGPAVRCQGNGDSASLYIALYRPGSAVIRLTKYVNQTMNGDGTLLGSYSVTLIQGDIVKIQAIGSSIKVFVNGVERISATDSDVTGGRPGAGVRNVVGEGLTAFTKWDDFNAGDGGGGTQSKWFAIWAIAKDDGTVAGLLSESFTSPTMPYGYSKKRRMGAVKTKSNTHFNRFVQAGELVMYLEPAYVITDHRVLSAGVATAFTTLNRAAQTVCPKSRRALMRMEGVPSGAQLRLWIRPTGSALVTGRAVLLADVSGTDIQVESFVDLDASQQFDYRVGTNTLAATIDVHGYLDPVF